MSVNVSMYLLKTMCSIVTVVQTTLVIETNGAFLGLFKFNPFPKKRTRKRKKTSRTRVRNFTMYYFP